MTQNSSIQTFDERLSSVLKSTNPVLTLNGTERFPSTVPDELLHSSSLYPDWQNANFSFLNAVSVVEAKLKSQDCRPEKTTSIDARVRDLGGANQSSFKYLNWLDFMCGKVFELPSTFFSSSPLIHPLGGSYALRYFLLKERDLDRKSNTKLEGWRRDLTLYMHVSELSKIFPVKSIGDLSSLLNSDLIKRFGFDQEHTLGMIRERLTLSLLGSRGMEAFLQGVPYYHDNLLTYYKSKNEKDEKETYQFFSTSEWVKSWSLMDTKVLSKKESGKEDCTAVLYDDCFVYSDRIHAGILFHLFYFFATCLVAILFINRLMMYKRESSFQQDRQEALAILAHELRTPLASMVLLTNNLRREFDQLSESGQKSALGLFDEINRLNRTAKRVDQFLIPAAEEPSPKEPISSLLDSLRFILESLSEDLHFEYSGHDRPSAISLLYIELIVSLLVRNALKHGRAPVSVKLEIEPSAFTLFVRDEGDLKKTELSEIMKPFYRRKGSDGLGLGLSLVQSLLKKMGSRLQVRVEPTVFFFKVKETK
jgi:anti-sigma regulatory factor (Ser/Thr protein kinase)